MRIRTSVLEILAVFVVFAAGISTASAKEGLTGKWTGSYTCAQGLTSLELNLKDIGGGKIWGTFAFSASPKNRRSVPNGSFYVYGRYDNGSKRVELNPGPWIKQPGSFLTIGLTGKYIPRKYNPATLTRSTAQLRGYVLDERCTEFQVIRTENAPRNLGQVPNKIHSLLDSIRVVNSESTKLSREDWDLQRLLGLWSGKANFQFFRRVILSIDDSPHLEIEGMCVGNLIPIKAVGASYVFRFDKVEGNCRSWEKARITTFRKMRNGIGQRQVKITLYSINNPKKHNHRSTINLLETD